MTESRIVAIGTPTTFRQQVARALGRDAEAVEWMPTVSAVEGSMHGGDTPPSVVVLSPAVKELDAFGLAESLGRSSPSTAILLVRDREMNGALPAAMRAGIRDVVDLSRGGEDLKEALQRAMAWSENLRSVGGTRIEADTSRGKLFSVFSSKGGTGKTFLSCNLAAAMAEASGRPTALVDIDHDLGDVFSYYGKEAARPLRDLLDLPEGADAEDIRAIGMDFGRGVWGFGAPADPTAPEVSGEAMGKMLRTLQSAFEYTVVDATADYSDPALAAFDLSDQIFLITGLDVVGVRHLSLALSTLLSLGFPRDRFRIVLNRADSKVGLSSGDVERVMRVQVDTRIPSSRLVPVSLNQGKPVVWEQPKSEVTKSVRAMAQRLVDVPATARTGRFKKSPGRHRVTR